jgi:PAS domain S-box-containing protein
MNVFGKLGRSIVQGRQLSLLGFLLVGLMLLGAGIKDWQARRDISTAAQKETTNLAIALAAQAARSVQAVDLVVREVQRETLAAGIDSPQQFNRMMDGEDTHLFLARHLENLPQAAAIGVIAADGTLINGSSAWPVPRLRFADKAWFAQLREQRSIGPLLTDPVAVSHTGSWMFFLARRVDNRRGDFLGVIAAGVEAGYFAHFYQEISLPPGGSLGIYARDGTLIARYPQGTARIGMRRPVGSSWYAAIKRGGGSYRLAADPDDAAEGAQLVSVVPLHDYPLVVAVAIPEQTVLGEWRRQTIFVAIGAGSLALGLALLVAAMASRSRNLERHSAELAESAEALRRSEARFRDFALTSSDWFWETDENHLITYVSESIRAFGQNPANFLGRSRLQLAASADRDQQKWDEHIAALRRHEPFRNFVYTLHFGGRPERTVSISGKPFFDGAGGFRGYHGTGRDITDESTAQQRLEEAKAAAESANLAKSQFLANVSHELRTPLNAIIGFAEMLELGMTGRLDPRQVENVGLIRQSGEHLHRVINDILDLAKVDAGKLDLYEEAGIDPRALVEGCLAFVKDRARDASITLVVEIAAGLPPIIADPLRLKQILLNLLSNAVKFAGPGGTVVAAARRLADGGLAIEVRDDGPGMTEQEVRIALEPFGQVDASLTRRYQGTGLGLPLARRLAELHGGGLEIRSAKGVGTTVIIRLPPEKVMAAAIDGALEAAAEVDAAAAAA